VKLVSNQKNVTWKQKDQDWKKLGERRQDWRKPPLQSPSRKVHNPQAKMKAPCY